NWKARNLLCFEDKSWSPLELVGKAIGDAKSWQNAQLMAPVQRPPLPRGVQPILPSSDFSCFVDAAWLAGTGNCGMGWLFKDSQGITLSQGSASRPFVPSALAAEALAVKHALLAALDNELLIVQVFSDSQTLVRLLIAKESTVELKGIIKDISLLRLRFISLSFRFVSRTFNVLADSLAKSALSSLNFSSYGV
ncbi:unnamed protein product, partial [Arabidopsis halleri]